MADGAQPGQPDLQGFWHNTTLTKMTRPAGVKSLVYTEEEVGKIEQEMVEEIEEGNAPTAADAPAEYVIPKDIKPEYLAGGGATGGYDFLLAPGETMRIDDANVLGLERVDGGRVWVNFSSTSDAGVDTRALTKIIRDKGAPHAVIAHDPNGVFDIEALKAEARAWSGLEGLDRRA